MRKPKLKFPAFAPEAQKSAACGPSSSLARQTFLQQSIMDSSWTLGLIRPVFTECNAGNAGHLESCWELESESETSTVSTLSRGYSLKHHERCSQSLTNTTQPTWVTMSYVSTVHKRNINKWHQQPVKSLPCSNEMRKKKNAKDPKIFKTNSIRSTVENPWKSASRWEHHHRGSCARQIVRENELNNLFLLRQLVWVNLSTVHCELQNNRAESGMYWYDHAKYVLFICRYKIINNN